jgi:hypothetical protein
MIMGMQMIKVCELPPPKDDFSVFQNTEKYLRKHPESEEFLAYFGLTKDRGNYRSLTDCIFCQFFPEWKALCLSYYSGKGRKLTEILSERELRDFDSTLLKILRDMKKARR